MRCYMYIVFVLFFNLVNSSFWYKDDFDRVTSGYQNSLSQDYFPYLRALSIFKRKLQLLGFYPIVSNNDGLEYVSLDPYIIEDDYDDRMYELLKKMKKEKKARKKLLKKKSKKAKKTKKPSPTTTTTTTMATAQPISNIVYYWPSTITTIVKPNVGSNTYEHSIETSVSSSVSNTNIENRPNYEDSSEEYSEEVDEESQATHNPHSHNKNTKSKDQKPAKVDYETNFGSERKLTFEDEVPGDTKDMPAQNKLSSSSTTTTTTSTTTSYPLTTIFPDTDEVSIQQILDQQEILNHIAEEEQKLVKDAVNIIAELSANIEDNLIENDPDLQPSIELPIYQSKDIDEIQESDPQLKETYEEEEQEVLPFKSTETGIIDETEPAAVEPKAVEPKAVEPKAVEPKAVEPKAVEPKAVEPIAVEPTDTIVPSIIPAGVLEFFHETTPELNEPFSSIDSSSGSEVVDNIPISNPGEHHISDEVTEATEVNEIAYGHSEIHSGPMVSTVQMKEETTTISTTDQLFDEHLTTDESNADKIYFDQENSIPGSLNSQQSEEYEFSIDPKISVPTELDDDVEFRSLSDKPVAVILDDKSNRRSDVPIEADDFLEEDTTDNLPYHLSEENVLEQSKQSNVIEDNSAETSTPPTTEALNIDDANQFGGDIIPLIPIIIKQMKEGNVIPEEMEILKNTFGQFWPFIVEEASRESDSSEEMNPILNDVLNSINRRVLKREATVKSDELNSVNKRAKREATVGRWRRPIYGRRLYMDDDDDDFVPRRRYYGMRRRPIVEYYYK